MHLPSTQIITSQPRSSRLQRIRILRQYLARSRRVLRIRATKSSLGLCRIESLAKTNIKSHYSSHVNDLVEVGLFCLLWWLVPKRSYLHGLNKLERLGAIANDAVGDGTDGLASYLLGCIRMESPV